MLLGKRRTGRRSQYTVAYSDLSVGRTAEGLDATVTVHNTGDRAGREIGQVYLGASPDTQAPQALRKLAGFTKITLQPGQRRRITIPVDEQQLRHWDTSAGTWQLGTGKRTVYVGPSAAETSLIASVTVSPQRPPCRDRTALGSPVGSPATAGTLHTHTPEAAPSSEGHPTRVRHPGAAHVRAPT